MYCYLVAATAPIIMMALHESIGSWDISLIVTASETFIWAVFAMPTDRLDAIVKYN